MYEIIYSKISEKDYCTNFPYKLQFLYAQGNGRHKDRSRYGKSAAFAPAHGSYYTITRNQQHGTQGETK
jgi:hypothetical protein